jgi:hypothetical protein
MANSNKVFVSPGVYTSETDLTFVAQSVGVTTLGVVGETLKGPAFEPVLISSFDEFKTYFGSTSPEKYGDGNPKYELPYVAKAYLQESNQLFVTKILGLTGYLPENTFGIATLGGMVIDSTSSPVSGTSIIYLDGTVSGVTGCTYYTELSTKYDTNGDTIIDYLTGTPFNQADFFTIGFVNNSDLVSYTGTSLPSPIGPSNKNWYNVYFTPSLTGVSAYVFEYQTSGFTNPQFTIKRYVYPAHVNTDYDNVIVAALRPRGHYVGQVLTHEVSGSTKVTLTSTTLNQNPFAEFTINVTGSTEGNKSYVCSLDKTSSKFISKVLGTETFDKDFGGFPIYAHETYPNLVANLFKQGLIRGLDTTLVYNPDGNDFIKEWDTPISPMVVSEVRGGKVTDLFQFATVSDGDVANKQIKITIQNINIDTGEFDVLIRDFYDTDDNVAVLEKYSRCSMNPDVAGYIGKKIGTADTEFELKSKYVMLVLSDNAPIDAIPAGFKGFDSYTSFGSNSKLGNVIYKTEYFDAGETIGYDIDGYAITTNGDNVRKVSLGLSSQVGFESDEDAYMFKGVSAQQETFGFHLSVNAASITGTTYKTTPYDLEGQSGGPNNKLTSLSYRKFTLAVCGGFDGWDIYRSTRTNSDGYIYNKNTYKLGKLNNGDGVFNDDYGNSDYYAYLKGIETFVNPEAVNINIFATPGLNFSDHESLTKQTIDMIENERADSLYIINSPGPKTATTSDEIVGLLENLSYDSNYSSTYWPWIQVRDGDNATQLYIPPTGEVVRNIAKTDNVAYPWYAVAGYSRGLVNSIKAQKKLTANDRDSLYKARINPIATFSDTGTIIWGNKTLQVRESALDRMNVRRLLLRTRKLISAVSVRLLFDQNDDQVRQEFLRLVNPILESIKKERGVYDFRVTVSNDPEDIDANTLRGKIYIKPTRSLEFIDIEFVITPTGASFENI